MSVIRWQRCVGCGVDKAHTLRNFYACKTGRYGLRIKCKECTKREVNENRALKVEHYRAYWQRRNREPARRAAMVAWRNTPKGRESHRLSNRMYRLFKALESRA